MRKYSFILCLLMLFTALKATAQTNPFNYQAVMRDSNGDIMQNQNITLSFDFRRGDEVGPQDYAETHSVTTNDQGLVNVQIGGGTSTAGSFESINWSRSSFLRVSVDGTFVGVSEFLSVPKANAGINKFRVDSILAVGNGPQANGFITSEDGKFHVVANVSGNNSVKTITIDDDNGQNVGIGTENPSEKLEVEGAIKITQETASPQPNVLYGNSGPLAYGYIYAGGTLGTNYGISSVTRINTGEYEITLDNAWAGFPIVSVTSVNPNFFTESGNFIATQNTNVLTVRMNDGDDSAVNTNFTIVVYGFPQ